MRTKEPTHRLMNARTTWMTLLLALLVAGTFGACSTVKLASQDTITINVAQAERVYATDLDGDGDADVLSASFNDDKIAWYENQSGRTFGPQQVIVDKKSYNAKIETYWDPRFFRLYPISFDSI